MIWIVAENICSSDNELKERHKYIKKITQAKVSSWRNCVCKNEFHLQNTELKYYQCQSFKGEYGIIITAHIQDVPYILIEVLNNKKSIVVVNSCAIKREFVKNIYDIVVQKNKQSELFFAAQNETDKGYINSLDDVGNFGFMTTKSDRMLYKNRDNNLTKAIRSAYKKINGNV